MSNIDNRTIAEALEWKIPADKIKDVLIQIEKYAELQDHWDSPYTRPSFVKVILLIFLIISVIIWVVLPIKKLVTSNSSINTTIAGLEKERDIPIWDKFAYNVEIWTTLDWQKTISLYDSMWTTLLWKSDLINNKAFILSIRNWKYKIPWGESQILKNARSDLTDDVKEDIYNLINNNISPNDKYLKFKSIDFGVDQVINFNW